MIDKNILKTLESNIQDPSYSIIISSFDLDEEFCNKDRIKINLQQINPNVDTIIEAQQNDINRLKSILTSNNIRVPSSLANITTNSVINKTLVIESGLNYDKQGEMVISTLNTFLNKESNGSLQKRVCKGSIKDHNITFTEKDYPNIFNKSKFRISGAQLIIKIPKKIDTISISVRRGANITSFTEADIVNGTITSPIPSNAGNVIYRFEISYSLKSDITVKHIESITTPLQKEIDISFEQSYQQLPAVIPTIDEDNKVYSSYTLNFEENESNEYIGVKITFNKFKRKKSYGDINITIIGD